MYQFDWERCIPISTPDLLRNHIIATSRSPTETDITNSSAVRDLVLLVQNKPLLYGPDYNLIAPNGAPISATLINETRKLFAKALHKQGVDKICLLTQTDAASKYVPEPKKLAHIGWHHVMSKPGTLVKIREAAWFIDPTPPLLPNSPYLADEVIYKPHFQTAVIVARYHHRLHMLHACYDGLSKYNHYRVLIDAMKGNKFLHISGLAHNDIKPSNIRVLQKNGKICGQLRDLEGVRAFGENKTIHTKEYMEWAWYGNEKKFSCSEQSDVFAWAITCYEVLGEQTEEVEELLQKGLTWGDREFFLQQQIDKAFPYPQDKKIQELLKSMVQKSQSSRPQLDQVIAVLEERCEQLQRKK